MVSVCDRVTVMQCDGAIDAGLDGLAAKEVR